MARPRSLSEADARHDMQDRETEDSLGSFLGLYQWPKNPTLSTEIKEGKQSKEPFSATARGSGRLLKATLKNSLVRPPLQLSVRSGIL